MRKPAQPRRVPIGTSPPSKPINDTQSREQALLHAQKLESVGAFACGITHDFSNILQVITGIADLVAMGEAPPERVPEMVQRIAIAARHGADLVHQLMAFARKQPTTPRPIDLGATIVAAVSMIERLMPNHVRVELELPAAPCIVIADPVQIEQVLLNLAANARDAMPTGGTLAMGLSMVELGDHDPVLGAKRWARITVRDTGCGMTDAVRARVFEPFFTTKVAGQGTGLGLATVATIVRQLDGRIDLETASGRGTTFTLWFRCSDVPALDLLDATVLVVEGDALLRQTIRGFLVASGARVIEAADPDDALHLIGDADAVVSDIVMPSMTGVQLCTLVHHHLAELPILLISSQTRDHLLSTRAITTDQPFLRTPFTRGELVTLLADLIARAREPIGSPTRPIPPAPRAGSSGHPP